MSVHEVVDKLTVERQNIILRLALDMLAAQKAENFDFYSPEDIAAIQKAGEEISRGDCLSFVSAEEAAAHFGVSLT